MKFRTEHRERTVPVTRDGITNDVTEQYKVRIPKLPTDWDAVAVRVAVAVVLGLTAVTVAWSTISIGALLGGSIGYAAAGVFDAAWLVNVLLEYLSRFDPAKRAFSKRLGWALLVATMGALFWHGLLSGSVALAVVGAAVSLFAKVLWMGIMRFINRDLSTRDAQWVAAEVSKANAQLAIAGVRRLVARSENRAALELLAAEQTRNEVAQWLGQGTAPAVESAPAPALSAEQAPAVSAPAPAPAEVGPAVRQDSEDVRPPVGNPLFKAPAPVADVRPDTIDVRPAAPVATGQTLTDTPRAASVAAAVRTLLAQGVTDPQVVTATVPALVGKAVRPDTVQREIRRQRPAEQPAPATEHTGNYL